MHRRQQPIGQAKWRDDVRDLATFFNGARESVFVGQAGKVFLECRDGITGSCAIADLLSV